MLEVSEAGLLIGTIEEMVFSSREFGEIARLTGLELDRTWFTDLLLERIDGNWQVSRTFTGWLGDQIGVLRTGPGDDNPVRMTAAFSAIELEVGNDMVGIAQGLGDLEYVDGGDGIDTLRIGTNRANGHVIDLSDRFWDLGSGIELYQRNFENFGSSSAVRHLIGTNGADHVIAYSRADTILGRGGDDTRETGNFGSLISGGDRNDLIFGGRGADRFYGDEDADALVSAEGGDLTVGGSAADLLDGGVGDDALWGGAGDDTLGGSYRRRHPQRG